MNQEYLKMLILESVVSQVPSLMMFIFIAFEGNICATEIIKIHDKVDYLTKRYELLGEMEKLWDLCRTIVLRKV